MKFLVKILFFLLLIFILNIIFYYISNDYKIFLEKLKYNNFTKDIKTNDESFENDNKIIVTNVTNNIKEDKLGENNINNSNSEGAIIEKDNTDSTIVWINSDDKKIFNTVLWKNYIDILNKFEKFYDLDKIEVNTNLFEITDEFPDYYYEYYSNDLTLYFFHTKQYSEVFDIFNYLQKDLPINIKELNNFWEKSFYINLNSEVNDKYIRLVITQNGITFWIKLKDSQYEKVKNILLNNI